METLNLSYIYADRDGYDECMRAGLKNVIFSGVFYNIIKLSVRLNPVYMCISDRLLQQTYL